MEATSMMKTKDQANRKNIFQKLILRSKDDLQFFNKINMSSNDILENIIQFIDLKDIINLKQTCRPFSYEISDSLIKNYIKSFGMNSEATRDSYEKFWIKFSNYHNFQLETTQVLSEESQKLFNQSNEMNLYEDIQHELSIIKLNTNQKNENESLLTSIDDISRDVSRTFRDNTSEPKQLGRILEAISFFKRDVGYCQGMNFIAAGLLNLTKSEEKAFWLLLIFLNKYELNNMFITEMPDYPVRVFQLNHYVKEYLPSIYNHFRNNKIPFDMIYSKWLITIFSQYLTSDLLKIDRWKSIIKFSLIFLKDLESELLQLDIEGVSKLLREQENFIKFHNDIKKLIKQYNSKEFSVKNKELRKLKEKYLIELAKKKLKDLESKWSHDQLGPLEEYLAEKNKIEQITKNDILKYKVVIEEIDKKFYKFFKKYSNQQNINRQIKTKLNLLVDQLKLYECMIGSLKKELENTSYISNLHKIRENDNFGSKDKSMNGRSSSKINFGFNFSDDGKSKKIHIEKEIASIIVKLNIVSKEVFDTNESMIQNYKFVDKLKYDLEALEKEKSKKKLQFEQYLIMYEKKEEELIWNLCQKLKLTENFVKFYKF